MSHDPGPIVQRAMLVGELALLRKEKGLTQKQVAARLEWSVAKLIRIEGGKQSISKTDLEAMLRLYGVEVEEDVKRFIELNRGAGREGWWNKYRRFGIDSDFLRVLGYEAGATSIRQSQNSVLPGALQTQEYAESIMRHLVRDPVIHGPLVDLRMERQAELRAREQPPHQTYVLDEAVVRRQVGSGTDPGIMPRQLHKLEEIARREMVEIRVVPFSNGAHQGMKGPLLLLGFDGPLDDVLYREGASDLSFSDRIDVVAEYGEIFEELLESTLDSEQSIELIREAAEAML